MKSGVKHLSWVKWSWIYGKKKKKKKCFYFWLLSFSAVEEISQCMRNAQDEYSEMKQNHRRMYLILQPRADVYIYIREYIILKARGNVLESAVTGRQWWLLFLAKPSYVSVDKKKSLFKLDYYYNDNKKHSHIIHCSAQTYNCGRNIYGTGWWLDNVKTQGKVLS